MLRFPCGAIPSVLFGHLYSDMRLNLASFKRGQGNIQQDVYLREITCEVIRHTHPQARCERVKDVAAKFRSDFCYFF